MIKTTKLTEKTYKIDNSFSFYDDSKNLIEVESGEKSKRWAPGLKCTHIGSREAYSDGEKRDCFIDGVPWVQASEVNLEEWTVESAKHSSSLCNTVFKVPSPSFFYVGSYVRNGIVRPSQVALRKDEVYPVPIHEPVFTMDIHDIPRLSAGIKAACVVMHFANNSLVARIAPDKVTREDCLRFDALYINDTLFVEGTNYTPNGICTGKEEMDELEGIGFNFLTKNRDRNIGYFGKCIYIREFTITDKTRCDFLKNGLEFLENGTVVTFGTNGNSPRPLIKLDKHMASIVSGGEICVFSDEQRQEYYIEDPFEMWLPSGSVIESNPNRNGHSIYYGTSLDDFIPKTRCRNKAIPQAAFKRVRIVPDYANAPRDYNYSSGLFVPKHIFDNAKSNEGDPRFAERKKRHKWYTAKYSTYSDEQLVLHERFQECVKSKEWSTREIGDYNLRSILHKFFTDSHIIQSPEGKTLYKKISKSDLLGNSDALAAYLKELKRREPFLFDILLDEEFRMASVSSILMS